MSGGFSQSQPLPMQFNTLILHTLNLSVCINFSCAGILYSDATPLYFFNKPLKWLKGG